MADAKTPAEIAERLQKRRLLLMTIFPILYAAQQGPFWAQRLHDASPLRNVDKVQITAYVVWSVALLILLATGGGLGRSRAVRELLSDEVTRDHRAKAYAAGFWGLILGSLALYVVSLFQPLTPMIILHGLLTIGVFVPCLVFVALERRAARG